MNCLPPRTTLLALAVAIAAGPAHAVVTFDQPVTPNVIFGSGNANGSFTVDRSGGIELGLRGKLRHNAAGLPEDTFNSNGDGTYSFAAGVAPTQSFPTAVWSFEWSINTTYDGGLGPNLSDLIYALSLDSDPSLGVSFGALLLGLPNPFDPINQPFADHSIGTNATGNGAGTEATDGPTYSTLIANNTVAQNSWKPHWFIAGFDPTVDGTYDISLTAFDGRGTPLASTGIQIIVGAGGSAAVPEPATLALISLGLAGIAGAARRRRR